VDSAARGISTGDPVRVWNEHGEVHVQAKVIDGRPGVCVLEPKRLGSTLMELGRDGAQHFVRITSRRLATERRLGASRDLLRPSSLHFLGRQRRLVVQAAK